MTGFITILRSKIKQTIFNFIDERRTVEFIDKRMHDEQIAGLNKQIDLLREKFNQLHIALNYLDLLKVKEIDDPAAKLNPVEIINKNERKTLMVFGGMLSKVGMMPPKEFFNSLVGNDLNIIFVKDFLQCWYQKGLVGKSVDIETTTEYLKTIIPKESETLICLGTSAGGYAAIRFGVDLGAARIIAFSPQTKISQKVFNRFKSLDSRLDDLNLKNSDLDLNTFLSGQINRNIELYYGKGNKTDVNEALHIKEHILPRPLNTSTHNVAAYLREKGLLKDILRTL